MRKRGANEWREAAAATGCARCPGALVAEDKPVASHEQRTAAYGVLSVSGIGPQHDPIAAIVVRTNERASQSCPSDNRTPLLCSV
jgi:hypothetical protein